MPEATPTTGKVKNVSGEDLLDSWSGGRLVEATQVIEVPLEQVYAYTQQADRWEPADPAAKKAHKAAVADREASDADASEPAPADSPEQPDTSGANAQEG